jgi:hypothetical protein
LTEDYRLKRARQAGDSVDPTVVYRYTPGATQLEAATMETWDGAASKVIVCSGGGGGVADPISMDFRTKCLTFKDRLARTAGRTVMGFSGAHAENLVAVQTGGVDLGLHWPGMSFLGGGGPVLGKRYHQFFSRTDGRPRGDPLILSARRDDFHSPCWAEDDQYTIYAEFDFEYLCIVPNPNVRDEKQ